MKLNWAERLIVNNPVRVLIQRLIIRWIKSQGVVASQARVLEVGCGRGAGACLILEEFHPSLLHALDLDHRMIRSAGAYLRPQQREQISLLVGDALTLPYRSGVLDAVFGFGVLHHLPDWRAGLAEIARVLKTRGRRIFWKNSIPPFTRISWPNASSSTPKTTAFTAPTCTGPCKSAASPWPSAWSTSSWAFWRWLPRIDNLRYAV